MITVDTNPKSLGTLVLSKPHSFNFALTAGVDAITITKITAGCGSCTTASIDSALIAANTTENFKVTFTPQALGETSKKVTVIYTENNIENNIVLEFNATVIN